MRQRLARSTSDLLNTLAAITDRKAGFRSLGDAWADTTTPHGRLMLTVPRRVRARPDPRPNQRRARAAPRLKEKAMGRPPSLTPVGAVPNI
jgi:DNA invertase Pin-like site-specific DNA recombinase